MKSNLFRAFLLITVIITITFTGCTFYISGKTHSSSEKTHSSSEKTHSSSEKTYTFKSEELSSVYITDTSAKITITGTSSDTITVVCTENDNNKYNVSFEDGKLSVVFSNSDSYLNFNLNSPVRTLKIEIPQNIDGSVSVLTISGNTFVENLNIDGKLTLGTTSADIVLENVSSKDDFVCNSTSGDISINDSIFKNDLEINGTSAEIELTNLNIEGFSKISSISGDINFKSISVNDFHLETISGNVYGEIDNPATEYTIINKTSDSIKTPDSKSGDKEFTVSSISGVGEITFKN